MTWAPHDFAPNPLFARSITESTCTGKKKKKPDLRRKRVTITLSSRTKEPIICCMKDFTFGLPNNKVILNQFVPAVRELLQDIPLQGATVQLQSNGLTTNETANGKKVYSYSTKSIRNDAYSGTAWVKRNWLRINIGIFVQQCANGKRYPSQYVNVV